METRRLEAFMKMVETGSLTRAADQLGIAQPSLSQQVLDLEAHFGTQLLVRTKRGVTATQAGQLLYRHSQNIVRQLKQAKVEIGKTNDSVAGSVAVGMTGSIAPVLTLPLLSAARSRFPGVVLRLCEGSSFLMSELALNGRLDFVVAGNAPPKGLKSEPLLIDELVLAFSSVNPPDDLPDGDIPIAALDGHPLILTPRADGAKTIVDTSFARAGIIANTIAEIESPYDLARAVQQGLGSTIIPWAAIPSLPGNLQFRRLINPKLERTVSISESDAMPISAPAAIIRTLVIEVIRDLVVGNAWPSASVVKDGPLGVVRKGRK